MFGCLEGPLREREWKAAFLNRLVTIATIALLLQLSGNVKNVKNSAFLKVNNTEDILFTSELFQVF
jgi:hypothetical protein